LTAYLTHHLVILDVLMFHTAESCWKTLFHILRQSGGAFSVKGAVWSYFPR